MVVDHFSRNQEWGGQISGPGIIVQIDESVFGHRKYKRGRIIPGHWILGMIANDSNDVFMVVVERRDAETLILAILKHVALGSIIHTDCWRGYISLPEHGYKHHVVNHSDPMHRFIALDGTHTQRIEATWRPAKNFFRNLPRYNDDSFADHLSEYL